ncbi:hypothetical protein GGI25_005012 [Coemansia spiralis]|uniref:Uncharacterized protein n=2 Tax=Coemansia TaxID=4863 RepID=A0A9W8KWW4_9FUNG|nr:hypothetical protein EDC05_004828 [Coemansia umbellata]KAJ2620126.1 hypothetical protein GGI26_005241 [Coemansia sp. RSA 1358]KAJ2672694.1 hypothetical protein GGI25_005012 [Coemansia spiralis]
MKGVSLLSHPLHYVSFDGLSMGTPNVLFFTNLFFTAIIARWFLNKQLTKKHGWLAVCCLPGIVAVVVLSLVDASIIALALLVYALLGVVLVPRAYVSPRGARGSIHAVIHVACFGIAGNIGSPILSFYVS